MSAVSASAAPAGQARSGMDQEGAVPFWSRPVRPSATSPRPIPSIQTSLLTAMPEVLRNFDQYRLIVYALLLIGMMLVRPQGLFGIHEIWDFWPKKRGVQEREQSNV